MTPPPIAVSPEFDEFLAQIKRVKKRGGYYTGLCPAHEDGSPSLSFRPGDDRPIVATCHAGCTFPDIYEAGMGRPLGRGSGGSAAIVGAYEYQDEAGDPLFQVVRSSGKSFVQQRYDSESGRFVPGLDGVRRVPYRLPGLLKAVEVGQIVFVVEGEGDADRLTRLGLAATTTGSATSWRPEHAVHFTGARVVIVPDNDEPGHAYALKVADSVRSVASEVTILRLPGLQATQDVSDWLDAGGTRDRLLKLADEALGRQDRLRIHSLADLRALPPLEYLVDGFVRKDGINTLVGPSGIGKTFVLLDLALSVATGSSWHGHDVRQGRVVFAVAEGVSGLRTRIDAWEMGRDMTADNIGFIIDPISLLSASDVDNLIDRVRPLMPDLIVIDPLARFAEGADENSVKDMSTVVAAVDRIRRQTGATILVSHHTGKDKARGSRGSSALPAAVDVELRLSKTGSTLEVKAAKNRDGVEGNGLSLNTAQIGGSLVLVESDHGSTRNENEDSRLTVLAALLSLGEGGATATEWEEASKRRGVGRTSFYKLRDELVNGGLVKGGGRGRPYRLTPSGHEAIG